MCLTYHFDRCVCEVDELRGHLAILTGNVKFTGVP